MKHTIETKHETKLWIGDRFYKVEECGKSGESHYKEFAAKCPCCEDTKEVKVIGKDGREYTADCPFCLNGTRVQDNYLRIYNWEVHEYIVNKIEAEGPATVSAYKNGTGSMDSVRLTGFYKCGRCENDFIKTRVPTWDGHIDPDLTNMDEWGGQRFCFTARDCIFTDKKEAKKFCNAIKEFDRKELAKFNETYHTDHEYPY